jgi:hypothetical protein
MIKKIIFVIIFLITFFVRLEAIKENNLPFTTDQGRDMIDIRGIAISHKPRLIGPTTSINGVYLGPFWYYFNLPPFVASGGDPSSILVWQIVWYQLAGLLFYQILKQENSTLAFFTSVFFLIMPLGFNTSRYSWNANAMPTFTALFVLALYLLGQKVSARRALLTGLLAGLSLQIEAAFGILFFPFSFLCLVFVSRKLKFHLWHLVGFLITLIPQGLFEIRHQFPLTKVLLTEFSGKSVMLGVRLSFPERLADRWTAITTLISQTSHLPVSYLFPIFGLVCFAALALSFKGYLTKSYRQFVLLNFAFIIFSLLFYLVFPQALKSWYLLGLSSPMVFLYSSSLASLWQIKERLIRAGLVALVFFSLIFTYTAQAEYLSVAKKMGDANKSSLKNSLAVIDWVYEKAAGTGFKAYSYLPSIYDYPYQYLYWWYGAERFGYVPNDLAYLPNQPEYIENRMAYLTSTRPLSENEPVFLIIERDDQNPAFEEAWLGNFSGLCLVEKVDFDFPVEIRHLIRCGQTN